MKSQKNDKERKQHQFLPQRLINIKFKPNYSGNFSEDKVKFLEVFKERGSESDLPMVEKALDLVYDLFKEDRRGDGTRFYTHFLETAHIVLTKFKISDTDTVVAALLHDSLEDKKEKISYEDIEEMFNTNVADIVDGVTKITTSSELEKTFNIRIEHELEYDSQELATIQKVFAYGLKNPRIFIVKFADRFHNVLTLYGIRRPERRREIAIQTINIFVPLIKVFGFEEQAKELRDLCLFHTIADDPDTAEKIYEKLKFLHSKMQARFLHIAEKYKLEENLSEIIRSVSPNLTLTVAHKTLSELWQAVAKPNKEIKEEIPRFYHHFYWVVNIPSETENIQGVLAKLDKIIKERYEIVGDDSPAMLNKIFPKEIIQDLPLVHRKFYLPQEEYFEIVYNLMPSNIKLIDIQNLVLTQSFYKNYDEVEYKAFLELIEYLYSQDVPNKMQILIEYAKKIRPSSYISVRNQNDNTHFIIPRGFTILDLAYKVMPNEALNVLGARIYNENGVSQSRGLNYVLQEGDSFEFIISSKPIDDIENLEPFSLNAINELRKIKQKKQKEEAEKRKNLEIKIFIKGVDKKGLTNVISEIAYSLQINFAKFYLDLSNIQSGYFEGFLIGRLTSSTQLNTYLIELLKIPEILEVKVEKFTDFDFLDINFPSSLLN